MSEFIEKVLAKNVLYTNMPIDLEIQEKGINGVYKSILYECDPKSGLAKIGLPIYKGAYMKIFDGTDLKVRAYSSRAIYLFKSKVLSSGKEGSVRYLLINIPHIVFRVQRRSYARIPITEEGFFYIKKEIEDYQEKKEKNPEKYRFLTKDFSAGGLALTTSKNLKLEELILINLNLKNEVKLKDIEAKIVRDVGKTQGGDYIYGVKFLNLAREQEEEFVRFVFKYERELFKNGFI